MRKMLVSAIGAVAVVALCLPASAAGATAGLLRPFGLLVVALQFYRIKRRGRGALGQPRLGLSLRMPIGTPAAAAAAAPAAAAPA